jgi:dCMP deaminase
MSPLFATKTPRVDLYSAYSGVPKGPKHCLEIGKCSRTELRIPSGQNYELCRSLHAEQNAIINATRNGVSIVGGERYIPSNKMKGGCGDGNEQDEFLVHA